jgi:hypothetical protein
MLLIGGTGLALFAYGLARLPTGYQYYDENGVSLSVEEQRRRYNETLVNSLEFKLMIIGLGHMGLGLLLALYINCAYERLVRIDELPRVVPLRQTVSSRQEPRVFPIPSIPQSEPPISNPVTLSA